MWHRNKSKKKKEIPVRLPLPSHLHREVIEIEPDEDITGAKRTGVETTSILEYEPGKFYVIEYNRPKYALPSLRSVDGFRPLAVCWSRCMKS